MTDAPERIALRWETGAAVTNGPLMTHPEYTRWVRADLAAAREAELRAEVERLQAANREAAMQSLADLGQAQEALDRAMKAEAEVARLRALLDDAREALTAIANRPSQMTWGEDHEIREAIKSMETMADAALAKIGDQHD